MNPCQCEQAVFSLFQGDSKTLTLGARFPTTGQPLDLSLCTAIVVNLPAQAGGYVQLTLADDDVVIEDPAVLGLITVAIDEASSALLNVGTVQDIFVTYTIDAKPETVSFFKCFSVFQALQTAPAPRRFFLRGVRRRAKIFL